MKLGIPDTEPPSRERVVELWPYGWTPIDDEHALYEARAGAGIYFVAALGTTGFGAGIWTVGVPAIGGVLVLVGLAQLVWSIRYSTFCFWWAGHNPWWMRIPWLRPVRVAATIAGQAVQRADELGRRWRGLVSLLSLLLGILVFLFQILGRA